MAHFMPINILAGQPIIAAVKPNCPLHQVTRLPADNDAPCWHDRQLALRPVKSRASLKVTFAERGDLMRDSARNNLKAIVA